MIHPRKIANEVIYCKYCRGKLYNKEEMNSNYHSKCSASVQTFQNQIPSRREGYLIFNFPALEQTLKELKIRIWCNEKRLITKKGIPYDAYIIHLQNGTIYQTTIRTSDTGYIVLSILFLIVVEVFGACYNCQRKIEDELVEFANSLTPEQQKKISKYYPQIVLSCEELKELDPKYFDRVSHFKYRRNEDNHQQFIQKTLANCYTMEHLLATSSD
ncbi:MAG: hypothetical protein ACXAC7_16620 [Candidatus Hodarchaeales archaeon]|jgi:hypothetical protein